MATIKERIKVLKMMDLLMSELDDETMYYDVWLALGVPDEATDDDLRYIAENDDDFYDICDLFMRLYNAED